MRNSWLGLGAWRAFSATALLGLVTIGVGCGGDGDFVSDNPSANGSRGTDDLAGEGDGAATSAGSGFTNEPPSAPPSDPQRIIAEADIVQVVGDRLYALSAFSGLAVIDLANPDAPAVLGRAELQGQPFEMYVEDGVVLAMFTGWGHQAERADGYYEWVTSSHVAALDVADPSAIKTLASFDLPGDIIDSRKVGDVLYTATSRYDGCWSCDAGPEVSIDSFLVDDPAAPIAVGSLQLPNPDRAYGWDRSISVSTDRIYVGGAEGVGEGSRIQVVDISDPGGSLALGASVYVSGQIRSRWQMDEYEGVLRVVSQPWSTSVYPRIQTFSIASSQSLTPLGQAQIPTPVPEELRATRFDGPRAYAITAERTDPLFTLDLSDPANPTVVGQLEIPGWVYHIEPRGDRLLALGFDAQNPEGGLNVSLFDVSVPSTPTLRRRVSFGGSFGDFAEDQDRVHKSFEIMPEHELLLVPYTSYENDEWGCGAYRGGVQLVDWKNDDLALRGLAEVRGDARRAFVHRDRLFTLSDEQLRGYDFANRDLLQKTSETSMAVVVSQVVAMGDHVVRLANDWWTDEPRIEIVSADSPSDFEVVGALDLGPTLAEGDASSCSRWGGWGAQMFVNGDQLYLTWSSWSSAGVRVAVVDLSDPTAPRVRSTVDVSGADAQGYGYYYGGYGRMMSTGRGIVQVGSTLAMQQVKYVDYETWDDERVPELEAFVHVVDLADPDHPRVARRIALPDSMGISGLTVRGDEVFTSRWESASSDGQKVRFFLDRIDVSNPAEASLADSINVPGSLVAFESSTGRAVLVDYRKEVTDDEDERCWRSPDSTWEITDEGDPDVWGDEEGECRVLHRTMKVVDVEGARASVVDELEIPKGSTDNLVVGEDRVFFTTSSYGARGADGSNSEPEQKVHVVGGIAAGELTDAVISLGDAWWASPAAASGQTLVAYTAPGSVVVIDTADGTLPAVRKLGDLPWSVHSIDLSDSHVFVSLGQHGVVSLPLHP